MVYVLWCCMRRRTDWQANSWDASSRAHAVRCVICCVLRCVICCTYAALRLVLQEQFELTAKREGFDPKEFDDDTMPENRG